MKTELIERLKDYLIGKENNMIGIYKKDVPTIIQALEKQESEQVSAEEVEKFIEEQAEKIVENCDRNRSENCFIHESEVYRAIVDAMNKMQTYSLKQSGAVGKYTEEEMELYSDYCWKASQNNRFISPLKPNEWYNQFLKEKEGK